MILTPSIIKIHRSTKKPLSIKNKILPLIIFYKPLKINIMKKLAAILSIFALIVALAIPTTTSASSC